MKLTYTKGVGDTKMIDTIIFDLDGTLIDSERVYFETYKKACNDFGGDIDLTFFKTILGKPESYDKEMLLKRFGDDFPVDEVIQRHLQYSHQYFDEQGVPMKEGVLSLLKYLKANGYTLVVASSSIKKRIQHVLKETGMDAFIDAYVGGDEVENGKPNPDIFLTAAKRVDAHPSKCMVVEDSEAGIEAGYHAKMVVVGVPDLKYPDEQYERLANVMIEQIAQLVNVLVEYKK